MLALLALALSSCVSLKENKVVPQTSPGKVTIRTVVCASNYDHIAPPAPQAFTDWNDCQKDNVSEPDNRREDATTGRTGQLLVGFRVPLGVDGPQSFLSKNAAAHFTQSETYTRELDQLFPPPSDQRWVGYTSTVGSHDPGAGPHSLELETDFTLPATAGTPFAGPFRWRSVVGFREGDPGAPVKCADATTTCVDSPPSGTVATDIATAVSDFGLVGGARTTVFAGTTAVVPFKLRYSDAAKLGNKSFAFRATTELPRASARPDRQTLTADPDSTSTVEARVPVPANTAPGNYPATLTTGTGSPAVTRTATGTIVVQPLPPGRSKPLRNSGRVEFSWAATRSGATKFTRLVVLKVPAGGKVTVRCRGRGCPPRLKAVKRRRTVNLSRRFRGRALRPRTVVTIRITGSNRIGKEIRLTMRRKQEPAEKVSCTPPGAKKALSCG